MRFENVGRCADELNAHRPDLDEFLPSCRTLVADDVAKGGYVSEIVEAEIACWRGPCSEVAPCVGHVFAERQVLEARREIEDARAGGDDEVLYYACIRAPEEARAGCGDVLRSRLERQRAEAEAAVAEGRTGTDLCSELTLLARLLGDEAAAADADESCAMLTAADAVADAEYALNRGSMNLPPSCSSAMSMLERQNAPWAAKMTSDVVDVCYRRLAIEILRREVPSLDDDCPGHVRRAWAGVQRHGIRTKQLGKAQAKAMRLCPVELIGVPECDAFITDYQECIDTKMPEVTREVSHQALDTSIEAWKRAAQTEAGRAGLAHACNTAADAVRASCEN